MPTPDAPDSPSSPWTMSTTGRFAVPGVAGYRSMAKVSEPTLNVIDGEIVVDMVTPYGC
jgi:hypothetical protein